MTEEGGYEEPQAIPLTQGGPKRLTGRNLKELIPLVIRKKGEDSFNPNLKTGLPDVGKVKESLLSLFHSPLQ